MTFERAMRHYFLVTHEVAKSISLSVQGVPYGACLTDGEHSVTVSQNGSAVDISRWKHDQLQLSVPAGSVQPHFLQALAVENSEGVVLRKIYNLPLIARIEPTSSPALYIYGLPPHAVLSDGVHSLVSAGEAQQYDLLGWNLESLRLLPPPGAPINFVVGVQAQGMNEDDLVALGRLKIRLLTPNRQWLDRQIAEAGHLDIVIEQLASKVQTDVDKANPAQTWPAERALSTMFDDQSLTELERKMRLH